MKEEHPTEQVAYHLKQAKVSLLIPVPSVYEARAHILLAKNALRQHYEAAPIFYAKLWNDLGTVQEHLCNERLTIAVQEVKKVQRKLNIQGQ